MSKENTYIAHMAYERDYNQAWDNEPNGITTQVLEIRGQIQNNATWEYMGSHVNDS